MKILIVEDEFIPATYLKTLLLSKSYDVLDIVDCAQDALLCAKEKKPDLILMDIMIKGNISGCEVALEIKKINPEINIIFLTAYYNEEILAYIKDAKAFSYLSKPYNDNVIIANIELLKLKISSNTKPFEQKNKNQLSLLNNFYFYLNTNLLIKKEEIIKLGRNERLFLKLLSQKPNLVLSNKEIIQNIWKDDGKEEALRALIFRLKKKTTNDLIINVSNLGYKLNVTRT